MKSLQMTTQNHKFKLTFLGLVMQGMGFMAHASCGTQTGTDYVIDSNITTVCNPPSNTTSITVNANKSISTVGQSAIDFIGFPVTLNTLSNSGTINSTGTAAIYTGWPSSAPVSITTIENTSTGLISSDAYGFYIDRYSTIGTIKNYGTIRGDTYGAIFIDSSTVTTIDNYGTLSQTATNAYSMGVISNWGSIGTLNNKANGVISGVVVGVANNSSIQAINNLGSIFASNGYGIDNSLGTISTLSNAQGAGNTHGALTYTGVLPTNYNIIITSTSNFGKLAVTSGTGNTTFGISSLSTRGNGVLGSYSSIITGLTSTQLGVTGSSLTSTSNGYGFTLAQGASATTWDLTISSAPAPIPTGPSAVDTQESLTQSATALRSVFNQQTAIINNSLNYDCTLFAENGVCVSGGGRFATPNSITGEKMSTLLITSYKAMKDIRVGGFIDQNVQNSNVAGVSMNKSPMYGVFGVWNERPDAMGYEVRLSSSWSNQDITQTRNVVGTSEAGIGTAALKSQATSAVVSYAMPVTNSTLVASPYAGVRKTKIARGGYTETTAVTTPLTYSDLSQDITTALAGVRMNKKYNDDLYVTASVGVEQNVGSSISTLDASGVSGLTATDFSANYAKTRPVASAGVSYAVAKDQRIHFGVHYRKEAFQSAGSKTGLLMYQVGL